MNIKVAIAASFLLATQAQAAEMLFSDRAAFEGTLTASVTDDYSNPGYVFRQDNAAMSAVLGETRYSATGFLPYEINIVTGGYYCAGCNGSFTLDFGSTSVSQGNGVYGVGFNFFNANGFHDALVTFGDGVSQLFDLGAAQFPVSAFWGITSTRQVTSIAFGPNGNPTTNGSFGIDNLTIGAGGAVPEAATWAMLIVGFGFIGAAARRRRSTSVLA